MSKTSMNSKMIVGIMAILFVSVGPLSSVNASPPTEATEFYYGVEYDWNSINPDIENFTGLDLPEIFSEFMGAADDAGFELIIGQIMSGSSNIYTHYSEDITPQTITDFDGEDVEVWSRTNDVTIRHGGLIDGIFMTEWAETQFSSSPTGFEVDMAASVQNVLNVDMTYTEYFDDANYLVGGDMAFSLETSSAIGFSFDAMIEGNGDDIPVEFELGMSYGYSIINSNSEWRLDGPSPIYTRFSSSPDNGIWECNINDHCGIIDGDYDASIDYSFSVSGIPTEDLGFDEGELDLEVSDFISSTDNDYTREVHDVAIEIPNGDSMMIDIGAGDGTTTNVIACESCPPGNQLMFLMMGEVITGTAESFAEDIADEFTDNLDEELQELLGLDNSDEVSGCTDMEAINYDAGATNDDGSCNYEDSQDEDEPMFECTDGTMIYEWRVNDEYYDCQDRSDEHQLIIRTGIFMDDDPNGIFGGMTVYNAAPYHSGISCDNNYVNYESLFLINDGYINCYDGSDEPEDYDNDGFVDNYFTCKDGGSVTIDKVMDGIDDCPGGSDEGKTTYYYDLNLTLHNEDGTLLNHRSVQVCSDPGDEQTNCNSASRPHMFESIGYWESEHDEIVCLTWELKDEFETLSTGTECITTGVQFDYLHLYQEWSGSTGLFIEAQIIGRYLADGHSVDFTLTDPNQQEIWSEQISSLPQWHDDYLNVRDYGPGDYCLTGTIYDREGAIEDTVQTCTYYEYQEYQDDEDDNGGEEIGDLLGIELSEKLNNIIDAMIDSDLQNIMSSFGSNLQDRLDDVEMLDEFPYNDGMFTPMWSNEHATVVGVGLYVEDENGSYVMAGPTTQGYNPTPPTQMSLRYLTGDEAKNAAEAMEGSEQLGEIVNIDDHNLDAILEDLAEAGIDISEIVITTPEVDIDNNGNGNGGDSTETPSETEEKAESDGLLPFVSPISVIGVIAMAGIIFGMRKD